VTTVGPPARYRGLLRQSAYLRVFTAGLASVAGSAIAGVCLVWLVYAETASALDVALLGTSGLVASVVFSVFGGAWVDRYDRRRLMILADLSRALALGLLSVDLFLRGFDLVPILAAAATVGAFTVIFNPAEQALIPSIVAPHLVADANGLVRSSRSILQFVGASVAGGLIATVGARAGIVANALTFVVSGLLLLGMRVARPPPAARGRPGAAGFLAEVAAGFAWLRRASGFLQLTLSATVFNFCSSIVGTFLVVFATVVLHGSALVFALLLAAEVAGAAIGSLLVGRTGAVRWAGKAWVVPYGATSAAVLLLVVLVPSVPTALGALFLLGALGGFAGTAWLTAAQLLVPPEMQGRYFGIDNLGSVAIIPAAQIGGALLITAYGVRDAYLAAGVVWLVAGLAFLAPRALWRLGYRDRLPSVPAAPQLVGADRPEELEAAEPRPEDVGEVELAVRRLPEQEVRDPLLPARPDDEVRVR
jgi:MFS family permease